MAVTTWSTSTVRKIERFDYWREVVCQTILEVATETPPEDGFEASISVQGFGALRFASFQSRRHQVVRGPQHIKKAVEANYLVSLQQSGTSEISQGDVSFALNPGEIAITDSRRPFKVGFCAPVDRIIAVVPQSVLEARAPWLQRSPALKIPADAPFTDLARRHLVQLTLPGHRLIETEANLLTDGLCNLLALATGREQAEEHNPDVQLEAILAYCRRSLFDPELSPKRVAQHFGISVRTLHLRFQRTGRTFGNWVLQCRLDACNEALRDPSQSAYNISEIAYRIGFNDLSHFCRVFKNRFGTTAREWRARTDDAEMRSRLASREE